MKKECVKCKQKEQDHQFSNFLGCQAFEVQMCEICQKLKRSKAKYNRSKTNAAKSTSKCVRLDRQK